MGELEDLLERGDGFEGFRVFGLGPTVLPVAEAGGRDVEVAGKEPVPQSIQSETPRVNCGAKCGVEWSLRQGSGDIGVGDLGRRIH